MGNIGIIGGGVLGKAIENGFCLEHTIRLYDVDEKKSRNDFYDTVTNSDVIFICVPTPYKVETEQIDLSIIEETIQNISDLVELTNKQKIIVIKSTVVPGTTDMLQMRYLNLDFVNNPEFLREGNAIEDFKSNQKRIVIGYYKDFAYKIVKELYDISFPDVPIVTMKPSESEILKYASNIMLASQVAISNIIFDLCDKRLMNYNKIREGLSYDKRIGTHTKVTEERGYGGKCFPKDMKSFISKCNNVGVNCDVLKAIDEYNEKVRFDRDWNNIEGAMS